jgi:SAM-dependent methyltransferase
MRESLHQKRSAPAPAGPGPGAGARHVPLDERVFFESYYRLSVEGEASDRTTIGQVTELESRFHYNATENSILRAVARIEPPPPHAMARAWSELQRRRGLRLLDVGSGTGHWVDFFRQVLLVQGVVAVEITSLMAEHLRRKYQGDPAVRVLEADVVEDDFTVDRIGGPVDYVSAIGVLFHIVDDARWERAMRHLAASLKPGGLVFVGGEFGARTSDVQFHGSDDFHSWREFDARRDAAEIRVNKRVRSLARWHGLARDLGLEIVDLVRSDHEPTITTPENDVLVLRLPG